MGSEEDGRSRIVCSTRLVRPFKHTTPRDFEEEEKGKNFLLEKRAERFSSSSLRHLSLSFFFLFIRSVISRPSSAISRPNLAGGVQSTDFSPLPLPSGQENTILPPSSTTIVYLRISSALIHGFFSLDRTSLSSLRDPHGIHTSPTRGTIFSLSLGMKSGE